MYILVKFYTNSIFANVIRKIIEYHMNIINEEKKNIKIIESLIEKMYIILYLFFIHFI